MPSLDENWNAALRQKDDEIRKLRAEVIRGKEREKGLKTLGDALNRVQKERDLLLLNHATEIDREHERQRKLEHEVERLRAVLNEIATADDAYEWGVAVGIAKRALEGDTKS